jgi:hypothetical protein
MINGEGLITGTVVSAAAIAASAGHLTEDTRLILAILGSVVSYWLAHARTLGDAVVHRAHPMSALREALAETWPILAAALVPVSILLIAEVVDAPIRTGAWIAVIASTVLLTGYSFLAGRRIGLLMSASVGAALGVLIILMKAGMH